jgi:hypothetical protein
MRLPCVLSCGFYFCPFARILFPSLSMVGYMTPPFTAGEKKKPQSKHILCAFWIVFGGSSVT